MGHQVHASSLVEAPCAPHERHGVQVHPLQARNPLWIENSGQYPAMVRLANKVATVFNRTVGAEIGALLDEIRPDILHTHSMVELPPAVWSQAERRGVPVVHTLHDYDLLCIRGALFKDGQACGKRHLACKALSTPKQALHGSISVAAAVSSTVMRTHVEHGLFAHLPPERRKVVWNPLQFDRTRHARQARAPGQGLRFGFMGRLVSEKGLGVLIDACRSLPSSRWTLRIAGQGNEKQRFADQAQGLPIRFEGHVDAPQFLSAIDVLVCVPLWEEPFGLTTLEAYAAGCRVIGSARGVIGEVVERIEPGWTVPPGDVEALAHAMRRAINDDCDLPALRQASVDALLSEVDPLSVARTYLELYESVCGTGVMPCPANG